MTGHPADPEFARPLPLEEIGDRGDTRRAITASQSECESLARRLGLEGLSGFRVEMAIDRFPGGDIVVTGRVVAEVVQTCVVTLEPVPDQVDEAFEVRFTTQPEPEPADLVIGPGESEPPEPLTDPILDIGELAAQQLALALNPWPRRPDVDIPEALVPDPARDGPFAGLAALRENSPEKDD